MRKILFAVMLTAIFVTSCNSGPNFSDVVEKEWKLVDVRLEGKSIHFNRGILEDEGFGEIFTLSFKDGIVSGKGAPNIYSAPYTTGDGQSINIQLMRSTLMAPIREPQRFKENDFYTYMQNAYKWDIVDSNLEIHTNNENDEEVILVFSL